MGDGTNRAEWLGRIAVYVDAIFVDKIFQRIDAELPIGRPKKFEFTINVKTAKQLGITIPPNVLARANRVIR
ncbi:MAG TPA: hypothetical protein VEG60_19750 [Candidatus Binatia bacterium]|nr:hypothetical protein [Candidatus Binatia bacterium]